MSKKIIAVTVTTVFLSASSLFAMGGGMGGGGGGGGMMGGGSGSSMMGGGGNSGMMRGNQSYQDMTDHHNAMMNQGGNRSRTSNGRNVNRQRSPRPVRELDRSGNFQGHAHDHGYENR